jgi:hypothetical protein
VFVNLNFTIALFRISARKIAASGHSGVNAQFRQHKPGQQEPGGNDQNDFYVFHIFLYVKPIVRCCNGKMVSK